MNPEPLIFPRGVRFVRPGEIPNGAPADAEERVAAAQDVVLTTGFVRRELSDTSRGYLAIFEANVHAPQLWQTFAGLVAALLPSVAAPIVGVAREEPELGDYTTRDAALGVLEPYADWLVNDGFLEFGCIFQEAGRTEEVFIPAPKFVRVWTNRPEVAERTLIQFGIPTVPNLLFADHFPLVRNTLPNERGEASWHAVMEALRPQLHALPEPW
jgi:hypothetical protein